MNTALALCAFAHATVAMVLFGTLAVHRMARRPLDEGARWTIAAAAWLALLTIVLWWLLETGVVLEDPAAALDPVNAFAVLTETGFGRIWQARLALALLLVMLVWIRSGGRGLLLVAAAMLLGSLALVGHPAAESGTTGIQQRAGQAVHLLAAGAWLGALPTLFRWTAQAAAAAAPPQGLVAVLRRFSGYGAVMVSLVLLSGGLGAWWRLAGWEDFLGTPYGRILSLKLALVAALLGNALFNRNVLTPALSSAPAAGLRRLRVSLVIESCLAVAIVAAASVLGATEAPR